ncbi:MAG TPA: carboxypeptidase regulatory-like domain-containing protein [Patescibacteria group bacterium]|nr:carboxypeptidase regulatory-like domain-containing protein [Patescibacteria group bacterium]
MSGLLQKLSPIGKFSSILALLVAILVMPTPHAFAATTTLSGSVKDGSGTVVSGATLTFTDLTHFGTVSATTDGSGNYSTSLTSSDSYNMQAAPPNGASLVPTTYLGVTAAGATQTFNFVLRASTHTVSGIVQDKNGVALPNETVSLQDTTGMLATTTTDANGNYSLTAPAYAYYTMQTKGTRAAPTAIVPEHFIWNQLLDLTSDSTTVVTVQAVVLTVSVREPSGAVPVGLASTSINLGNSHTTGGYATPTVSGSFTYYGSASGSGMHPDANGDYNLVLPSSSVYALSVIGSNYDGYGSTTVPLTSLGTSDTALTATLPTSRHTVSGAITNIASQNGSSSPIAGLTVALGNPTTGRYQTTSTDVNGHYSFTAGTNAVNGTSYSLSLSQATQSANWYDTMPGSLNASMSLDLSADRTGNVALTFDPVDFTVYDTLGHTMTTNVKINNYGTGTLASPFTGAGTMTTSFTGNYTLPAYGAAPLYERKLIHGLTYNNTFSGPTSPATSYGSVTSNGFQPSGPFASLQVYVPNYLAAPTSFTNTTATPGYPSFSWSYSVGSGPAVADHYNIYEGSELIGSTTSHSYTDTSVSGTGGGTYQVSVVNAQGTEGPRTSVLTINYTTP